MTKALLMEKAGGIRVYNIFFWLKMAHISALQEKFQKDIKTARRPFIFLLQRAEICVYNILLLDLIYKNIVN